MKYLALILLAVAACAYGHVHLREPVARTSIQTRPEFNAQQPFWWDHYGVMCGDVRQNTAFSTCGRCGEANNGREASQGGRYDKGIIVATYTAGSIVQMTLRVGAAHYGGFTIELCPAQTETDNCFQFLRIVSADDNRRIIPNAAGGNRLCIPYEHGVIGGSSGNDIHFRVQLPANVRCNRCTIRMTHRTFYPWSQEWAQDNCFTPLNTQTFRNCADVRIV
ncbi:hypothetical protein HA402_010447 [Bradysia odoriphaga]|nr:hypothetical protein HA402_010447 [Bradysia odoriphaga]